MKNIYKLIENGINYTVIESDNIKNFNNIILHNFWYKIPKKYHNSIDIKIIIHYSKFSTETCYFYNRKEHNIYGPSYIKTDKFTGWYYHKWYINGKEYTRIDDWNKTTKKLLRAKKLTKINRIYNI